MGFGRASLRTVGIGAAVAGALALGMIADGARAATVSYEFSGLDAVSDPYTAQVSLTVSGGFAVSGSGTITDAAFGGTQALTLVTAALPDVEGGPGNFGYRSNRGDDFFGFDSAVPITSSGGLLFVIGTTSPVWGKDVLFGIYGDGKGGYQSGFFGQFGSGPREWGYNIPASVSPTVTGVSAVPEPSTWAMVILGFLGLGLLARRGSRRGQLRAA